MLKYFYGLTTPDSRTTGYSHHLRPSRPSSLLPSGSGDSSARAVLLEEHNSAPQLWCPVTVTIMQHNMQTQRAVWPHIACTKSKPVQLALQIPAGLTTLPTWLVARTAPWTRSRTRSWAKLLIRLTITTAGRAAAVQQRPLSEM